MARLSADDWQLFTASMKCGAAARAMTKELNLELKAAKFLIKKGFDRNVQAIEVRNNMQRVMHQYRNFGACDTEPQCVLVDTINKELHTDIGRW